MASESWPAGALAVTALGVVSPLGWDAASSCAAARAGLLRLSPLDDYTGRNPDTGDAEPVLGHTVSGCTEGFTGAGRLVRLGVAALAALRRPREEDWEHTGLVLNLSSGLPLRAAAAAAGVPLDLGSEDAELPEATRNALRQQGEQHLLARLTRLAEVPIPSHHWRVIRGDQAGFLHGLAAAASLLEQRAISRCIVGGIDSYVDRPVVEALDELRLLKTASRPHGILPGECSAFLQVEPLTAARRRGARIDCVLGAQALHHEAHDASRGVPGRARRLPRPLPRSSRRLPPDNHRADSLAT